MKIKVFSFDTYTPERMEKVVNLWMSNANHPAIASWMQTESSVWDLNSGDYPQMRTNVTLTIVYHDGD